MLTRSSPAPDRRKLRWFLAVLFLLFFILAFTRSLARQSSKVTAPAHGKLHARTGQGYSPAAVNFIPVLVETGAK
jgi:hypothetical protein